MVSLPSNAIRCHYYIRFLLLVLLLSFSVSATWASKVSVIPKRRGKDYSVAVASSGRIPWGGAAQSRRWERMDGRDLGGNNSLRSSLLSGKYDPENRGRACGFYIWDAPSALLHSWCHHLLKDCVYEGLGGRKFVRIEPGSILQLLYPCSRYSPDRCFLCGGNYKDHLTLWWAKHLYTPFDHYIDKTHAAAVVLEPKYPGAIAASRITQRHGSRRRPTATRRNRQRRNYRKTKRRQPPTPQLDLSQTTKVYAFHRKYVLDLASLAEGVTDKRERVKKIRKELTKIQLKVGSTLEVRMLTDKKKAYVVPSIQPDLSSSGHNNNSNNNNINNKTGREAPQRGVSAQYVFARYMFLNALDRLIGIQETENDRIRQKDQFAGCCL